MAHTATSRPYTKIMVPFDGSGGSSAALRRAIVLARSIGGEVVAFSVDEHVPLHAPGVGEVSEESEVRNEHFTVLRTQAQAVASEFGAQIRVETSVGHAAQSIVRHAEERGFDLIVIGRSGHSGALGKLLGSTTSRVVDQAHCDVLVVRQQIGRK